MQGRRSIPRRIDTASRNARRPAVKRSRGVDTRGTRRSDLVALLPRQLVDSVETFLHLRCDGVTEVLHRDHLRISMFVLPPKLGLGARLAHSMASSSDFAWIIQNPAMSSFVSVNGPSTTVFLSPSK